MSLQGPGPGRATQGRGTACGKLCPLLDPLFLPVAAISNGTGEDPFFVMRRDDDTGGAWRQHDPERYGIVLWLALSAVQYIPAPASR